MKDNDFVDLDLLNLRQGIDALYKAVEGIATREPVAPKIADRSLSGNAIYGGIITGFESNGIKDTSTRNVVLVNDKGIHTDNINVKNLLGDTNVQGSLFVKGEVHAKKLHVNELTSDVRIERTTPLEFTSENGNSIEDKGIVWKGQGNTKLFVYKNEKLWSSESLELHRDKSYHIDGLQVLSLTELGSSVRNSNLTKVGTLNNLHTSGNLTIDEYVFYESASQKLGIGTDAPSATVSIASYDGEFIIDVDEPVAKIGSFTASDIAIVTDNTARISVSSTGNITIGSNVETKTHVQGKLGINIKNPDCDITTAGPVRFQGKKQEVGENSPTSGIYRKGDIVWNENPKPTGYVGWICVRDGTPGDWKPFGQISN